MRPRIRGLAAVLATVILAAMLAACGSSSKSSSSSSTAAASASSSSASTGSKTATTVGAGKSDQPTLVVGDQAGTGAQALLQAAGLLTKLPFPVKFADFTSGPPILQAMSGGSVDIGNVGNAPPVFAAAGGEKIKIVGALKNDNTNVAILVPEGSKITSVSQLKGKKVGVAQGSSGDYHLLYELNQAGLSAKDVQLTYLQPAQGLAAFSSGAIDAWDVWPPFVEQAEIEHHARLLVGGQGFVGNYSYAVASDDAISNPAKAKEITEYLKLLNQAHRWANTHSAAWARTWGAATGLPADVMTKAAAVTIQTPVPVDATVNSQEQGIVTLFYKAGLIPNNVSISQFSTPQFNSSVG